MPIYTGPVTSCAKAAGINACSWSRNEFGTFAGRLWPPPSYQSSTWSWPHPYFILSPTSQTFQQHPQNALWSLWPNWCVPIDQWSDVSFYCNTCTRVNFIILLSLHLLVFCEERISAMLRDHVDVLFHVHLIPKMTFDIHADLFGISDSDYLLKSVG